MGGGGGLNMDNKRLNCAKDVFVLIKDEKELAKIKAIISGSDRGKLKVSVN